MSGQSGGGGDWEDCDDLNLDNTTLELEDLSDTKISSSLIPKNTRAGFAGRRNKPQAYSNLSADRFGSKSTEEFQSSVLMYGEENRESETSLSTFRVDKVESDGETDSVTGHGDSETTQRKPSQFNALFSKLECLVVALIYIFLGMVFVLPMVNFRELGAQLGDSENFWQLVIGMFTRSFGWFLGVSVSKATQRSSGSLLLYGSILSGVIAAIASAVTNYVDRLDTLCAVCFVVGSCCALLDASVSRALVGTTNALRLNVPSRTHIIGTCFYLGVLLTSSLPTFENSRRKRDLTESNFSEHNADYSEEDLHDDYVPETRFEAFQTPLIPVTYSNVFLIVSSVFGVLCLVYLPLVKHQAIDKRRSSACANAPCTPWQVVCSTLALFVLLLNHAVESALFTLFTQQFSRTDWSMSFFGFNFFYAWFGFWSLFIIVRILCVVLRAPSRDVTERRDSTFLCAVATLLMIAICGFVALPDETFQWIVLAVLSVCMGAFLALFTSSYPTSWFSSEPDGPSASRLCAQVLFAQVGYATGFAASLCALHDNSGESLRRVLSVLLMALVVTTLLHRLLLSLVYCKSRSERATLQDDAAADSLLAETDAN